MSRTLLTLVVTLATALGGCPTEDDPPPPPEGVTYPSLLARPEHRELVLDRIEREPYATIHERLVEHAERELEDPHVDSEWDSSPNGHNGQMAVAAAFLAWLHDDEQWAERARESLAVLPTDWETNTNWDINIRMPATLINYTNAWDLLMATPYFPEDEAADARERICEIDRQFYERYVLDEFFRNMALGVSQNNHPIRTAAAMGYPMLRFGECEDSQEILDFALSELDYLWSAEGRYVQADGAVSEGPFYHGFGAGAALATFIAVDNIIDPGREFHRDCINRQEVDPWFVTDCVDGQPFVFANPLLGEQFPASIDWSISIRLPSGYRPPLGDAYFNPLNSAALLTAYYPEGRYRWDWESTDEDELPMTHGMDMVAHHLIYVDEDVPAAEPDWTTRFFVDGGEAVLRSGWGRDDLWLLLVGEGGAARKTLHDHVDGTSFSFAAFGDYLLIDPGYYKPSELDNAVTADALSHNVILIDGQGAPDKGLLTNWGDADASIEHPLDAAAFDYAEAHQQYEQTTIERSTVLVRDRYAVIADRLETTASGPREHAWRIHGFAGFDSGGSYTIHSDGVTIERESGGLRAYLTSTSGPAAFVEPEYAEFAAPHVQQFERDRGIRHHAVIDGVVLAEAPGYLAVLAPYRAGAALGEPDGPPVVTTVPAEAGHAAWMVTHQGNTDLVWLREPGSDQALTLPTGEVVETDAELLILGLDDGVALLARGTSVALDGAVVASVDAIAGVAAAD